MRAHFAAEAAGRHFGRRTQREPHSKEPKKASLPRRASLSLCLRGEVQEACRALQCDPSPRLAESAPREEKRDGVRQVPHSWTHRGHRLVL